MTQYPFYHELDDRDYNCVCGHYWPCPDSTEFLNDCSKLSEIIGDYNGAGNYATKAALARPPISSPYVFCYWEM